jgi:hypothetical protein
MPERFGIYPNNINDLNGVRKGGGREAANPAGVTVTFLPDECGRISRPSLTLRAFVAQNGPLDRFVCLQQTAPHPAEA